MAKYTIDRRLQVELIWWLGQAFLYYILSSPTLLENVKMDQFNDPKMYKSVVQMSEGEEMDRLTYSDGVFHFLGKS